MRIELQCVTEKHPDRKVMPHSTASSVGPQGGTGVPVAGLTAGIVQCCLNGTNGDPSGPATLASFFPYVCYVHTLRNFFSESILFIQ